RASAWWRGGILALLIVAVLPPEIALLRIPLVESTPTYEPASPVAGTIEPSAVPLPVNPSAMPAPVASRTLPIKVSWIWLWLAGVVVLGVRLLLSQLRVAALIRSAKPVQDPDVLAIVIGDRGDGRKGKPVEIKVHQSIKTPFA